MQACFHLPMVINSGELEAQTEAQFLSLITLHGSEIYIFKRERVVLAFELSSKKHSGLVHL